MKNAPYCSFAPAHHWMNARCNSIAVSLHHSLLPAPAAYLRFHPTHLWGEFLSATFTRRSSRRSTYAASFKVDPASEAPTHREILFPSTLSAVSWRLWQEGFQSGVRGPPTGPTGAASRWTWKLEFSVFFFFFFVPTSLEGLCWSSHCCAYSDERCGVFLLGTSSHYNFPRTEKYKFEVFRPPSGKH